MNREQNRMFELLREFDAFCADNNIIYFLSGDTLLYAVCTRSIEPDPVCCSVVMDASNCGKFIGAFEKNHPDNRELEYWGNSEIYPDYTVRYVASDTTGFSVLDYLNYRTHGMSVEIQILRGDDRKKQTKRYLAIEKSFMEEAHLTKAERSFSDLSKQEKKDDIYVRMSVARRGKADLKKAMFEYFLAECGHPVKPSRGMIGVYTFINCNHKIKDVSQYYFENAETCLVEGAVFPIPACSETLLKIMYPSEISCVDGKACLTGERKKSIDRIIDTVTPYDRAISDMGITAQEIQDILDLKKQSQELFRQNQPDSDMATEDWKVVKQTSARFRMWKYYLPLKAEIAELYASGDYESLAVIFQPYTDELDNFLEDERSFSFDNDILKIYLAMLEHQGKYGKAAKIISLIPAGHFTDIEMYDI